MRDIKFRAWNSDTREWIHREPCSIRGEAILLGAWLSGVPCLNLGDVLVEQYTGLNDSEGAPIFEGDMVEYQGRFVGEVCYYPNYGCWGLNDGGRPLGRSGSSTKYEPYFLGQPYHKRRMKVVGNIHDGPA